MTLPRKAFAEVAAAALARVDQVLARWLPEGKRRGREYVARNPKRPDRKPGSFSINLDSGAWADFASADKGGDLVALVAYLDGVTQAKARDALATFLQLDQNAAPAAPVSAAKDKPQEKPQEKPTAQWTPIVPVPDDAPVHPSAHPKHGKPSRVWTYRDAQGRTLCHVCRFDFPQQRDRKKEILPLTFCEGPRGRREWRWLGLPVPRPLYHLDQLAALPGARVIVCEGEKAADAAAQLLPECVTTTSLNGAQSPRKTDWLPLAGRNVWLWPDHDEPGRACMQTIAELLQAAGAREIRLIDPLEFGRAAAADE